MQKVELVLLGSKWDTPDLTARSLALYEADALDVMNIWAEGKPACRQHPAEHISFPMFWTVVVILDTNRSPFDDPRVRRAFVLALDRKRFVDEVWQGLFTPADGGFIPPGMPGHSAGIGLPYDPPQARQLLAEVDYPGGCGFPSLKGMGGTGSEIENLQAQWQENLGIEIEWPVLDRTTTLETVDKEQPHLRIIGPMAGFPDPNDFLPISSQGFSLYNWYNDTYDHLVEKARRLSDLEQRLELYQQADRILVEDIPFILVMYMREHLLVKPWIRNYFKSPVRTNFWKDVIIEPH